MQSFLDDVWDGLRRVIDPELGINMVDLGLVYEIELEDEDGLVLSDGVFDDENDISTIGDVSKATITMTLTTPGCPLGGYFLERVAAEVAEAVGLAPEDVAVKIVFDPPWAPAMMNEESAAELGLD